MKRFSTMLLLFVAACFFCAVSGVVLAVHLHCEHHCHNHDNGPDPEHCPICRELLAITKSMHFQFAQHFAEILSLKEVVCMPHVAPDALNITKPFDSRPPPFNTF